MTLHFNEDVVKEIDDEIREALGPPMTPEYGNVLDIWHIKRSSISLDQRILVMSRMSDHGEGWQAYVPLFEPAAMNLIEDLAHAFDLEVTFTKRSSQDEGDEIFVVDK